MCIRDSIDFTEERCFTTTSSVCVAPDHLYEIEVWQDEAILTWEDPLATDPDVYYLRYRKKGTSSWIGQDQYVHGAAPNRFEYSRAVSNLEFCTEYEWQIRKYCDAFEDDSSWSPLRTFSSDCRTDIGDFWISNVSLDKLNVQKDDVIEITSTVSYSGASPSNIGSQMYYYLSIDETPSFNELFYNNEALRPEMKRYSVGSGYRNDEDEFYLAFDEIRMPFAFSPGEYNIIMCIDGEEEHSESNENNNCFSVPITLGGAGCTDVNAHNYDTNADVDNGSCQTCSDGIKNGDEVEIDCGGDLCSECVETCDFVPDLVGTIYRTSMVLSWTDPNSIGSYSILLQESGEDGFIEYFTTSTSIVIDGLSPQTEYLIKLRTYCESIYGETVLYSGTTQDHIDGCTYEFAHNYNPSATRNNGNCETCFDDIQNGDEAGVDCGGTNCIPCHCDEVTHLVDYNIYDNQSLQVKESITASNVIYFSDVEMRAGESINFEAGFEVGEGSSLIAITEVCPE